MTYKLKTYKTLTGTKEILEPIKKKSTEAIIYQNDKPAFFVNCFDLHNPSNLKMNSLVLCQQRSIEGVIKYIAKKNNLDLSIKEKPMFAIEVKTETKELKLPPLPLEWLN